VFTGFCVGFKFLSLRFSEHIALQHLTRYLRKDDLVLLDRGFFSLRRHLANRQAGRIPSDEGHAAGRRIRQASAETRNRRFPG
jgi:hypothetical protein